MICEKKVSFYVSKFVTNDYLNPHLKASDRLSEHKIIAHDKQVKGKLFSTITNKRFTVDHTVMNFVLLPCMIFSSFFKNSYILCVYLI